MSLSHLFGRICRVCSCTEHNACVHPTHGACWWIEGDLCSHCVNITAPLEPEKSADLSECGAYRFTLDRVWDLHRPTMTFIMLNPSTADAREDDPTIRRSLRFAWREGAGAITVVNLSPLRATNPAALIDHVSPKGISEQNIWYQREALKAAWTSGGKVVCAWGKFPGTKALSNRLSAVASFIGSDLVAEGRMPPAERPPMYCLGTCKDGRTPRHPLYVRADQPLEAF